MSRGNPAADRVKFILIKEFHSAGYRQQDLIFFDRSSRGNLE